MLDATIRSDKVWMEMDAGHRGLRRATRAAGGGECSRADCLAEGGCGVVVAGAGDVKATSGGMACVEGGSGARGISVSGLGGSVLVIAATMWAPVGPVGARS